jgi:acyl-CoA thioesterase
MSEPLDAACVGAGIVADHLEPGRAVLRMPVTEAMVNAHGTVHGGYLFLLADAAFAYAANTGRPTTVASGAHIAFLLPVELGETLVAEAVERSRAWRTGVYDVTVRDSRGQVVAELRGQSAVVGRVRATENAS